MGFDFGPNVQLKLTNMEFYSRIDIAFNILDYENLMVQGSNDGTSYVDLFNLGSSIHVGKNSMP